MSLTNEMLELLAQEKDLLNKLAETQAKIAETKDKLAKENIDLDAIETLDVLDALALVEASKPNEENPNLLAMITAEAVNAKIADLRVEYKNLMEVNNLLTAEEAINDQDISQLEEEIEWEKDNIKNEGTYLFNQLQSKLTLLEASRCDLKTRRELLIHDIEALHEKIWEIITNDLG